MRASSTIQIFPLSVLKIQQHKGLQLKRLPGGYAHYARKRIYSIPRKNSLFHETDGSTGYPRRLTFCKFFRRSIGEPLEYAAA
jgi:hypothetical protein